VSADRDEITTLYLAGAETNAAIGTTLTPKKLRLRLHRRDLDL
jgi:hypothetical protein